MSKSFFCITGGANLSGYVCGASDYVSGAHTPPLFSQSLGSAPQPRSVLVQSPAASGEDLHARDKDAGLRELNHLRIIT